jgi:hypothetical protein
VPAVLATARPAAGQACAISASPVAALNRTVIASLTRANCQLKPDELAPFVGWVAFDWPTTGLALLRLAYTGYYLEGQSALLSGDGELVAILDEELRGWEDMTVWLPAGRYYVQLSHNLNEGIDQVPFEVSVRATTLEEMTRAAPTLVPWTGATFRRLCTRASSETLPVNETVRRTLPRPREGCTLARAAPSFEPYVAWTDEVAMYRFSVERPERVTLSYDAPAGATAVLLSGRFGDPLGSANDDPDNPSLRPRPLAFARAGAPVGVRLQPGEYFVAVLAQPDRPATPFTIAVTAEP